MRSLLAAFGAAVFLCCNASAHDWYSARKDPVYEWSCCGGNDCATWAVQPGEISAETDGYRVTLSLERSRTINPQSLQPIDALVVWDRVQQSEDGNWHLCIMTATRWPGADGVYCLFAPPNT